MTTTAQCDVCQPRSKRQQSGLYPLPSSRLSRCSPRIHRHAARRTTRQKTVPILDKPWAHLCQFKIFSKPLTRRHKVFIQKGFTIAITAPRQPQKGRFTGGIPNSAGRMFTVIARIFARPRARAKNLNCLLKTSMACEFNALNSCSAMRPALVI